ncbi:hypothetical protein Btru_069559 [Bulinus truncatus]|nr:hypothetical protein Btru_069559 [Bulinus truncatus]
MMMSNPVTDVLKYRLLPSLPALPLSSWDIHHLAGMEQGGRWEGGRHICHGTAHAENSLHGSFLDYGIRGDRTPIDSAGTGARNWNKFNSNGDRKKKVFNFSHVKMWHGKIKRIYVH